MKKTFVIDTSILLYDLDSLFKFGDNTLIIPSIVMEEIDHLKSEMSERGYAARKTLEILEELTKVRPLMDGVILKEIGKESPIYKETRELDTLIKKSYSIKNDKIGKVLMEISNDALIVSCALNHKAILVTRDRSMRVFAKDFVDVEEYKADQIKSREVYKGYRRIKVLSEVIDSLFQGVIEDRYNLHPNEFAVFESAENPQHVGLGIKKREGIRNCDISLTRYGKMKTKALNLEQKMFLYLLHDDDITCVTASGVSGKGKSLLAVDYGLSTVDGGKFVKMLYTKPATPLDKNEYLGYTKGDTEDKMKPHLQPLYNSIEFLYKKNLYSENKQRISVDSMVDKLIREDTLNFCPLVNIRGMSIFDKILILDEAQNTTNHTMKTLVTRMTDTSKLVILGDIEQIDDKNLNKFSNGMSHLIEEGKDEYFIGHICMDIDGGSRRGKLSEFGAKNL